MIDRTPLTNLSSSQLEYLLAATEEPTWKDAAAAVGVTPSALSQGIAELERRLGLTLFDRQQRKRVPTAAGIEAAGRARRVLAELRELHRWAGEVREGTVGDLSIGMIDTAAIHHFGDVLVGFRHANPDVTLRLQVRPSNELIELLFAGEIDAAVVVDPPDDDRLTLQPLLVEPLYAYAPPGSRVGAPKTWGPWVGFASGSRTRSAIARELRRAGANYEVVAESSQPAVLREMVQLGMGWCVLPVSDAESEPHSLTRARAKPIAKRTLTLVQRSDRSTSAALETLLDTIRSAAT